MKMKQPGGYEGGSPYWILPSGQKTYDCEEWHRTDNEYWKVRMNKIIKIAPYKARRGYGKDNRFYTKTINTMICGKFDGKSVTLKRDDILNRVCNESSGLTGQEIFNKHYLVIEPFYRERGWKVEYDKPGYNENYPATFTFKIP